MSTDQLLLVLAVAVIANVVLMAAIVLPPALGRRALFMPRDDDAEAPSSVDVALQMAAAQIDAPPEARAGLTGATYDKVVRIVAYGFLVVTAVIVAVSQEWSAEAPFIYVLLAAAAVFVLFVHDLLPSTILGPGKFVLEGSAALAFFTVLIALTVGVDRPFFFGYYLVVAGGALVVAGAANYLLAAVISVVYLLTIAGLPGAESLSPTQLIRLAFSLVALWLLSYLASVIAHEQRHTRDAALRLSLYDPLTRLYNRSYFYAVMEREIQRAGRTGRGFCLLMVDLDHLKAINDEHGHHAGDRVLREVSLVIRRGIRSIDAAARLGGDEFMILLPETELGGAVTLAEKLRVGAAALRVDVDGTTVRPSVSVGVVGYPEDGQTGDQLLVRADEAMYVSKGAGRDRVATLRQTRRPPPSGTRRRTPRAAPEPAPLAAATTPTAASSARAASPDRSASASSKRASSGERPASQRSRAAGTQPASERRRASGTQPASERRRAAGTQPASRRRFHLVRQDDPHFRRTSGQFISEVPAEAEPSEGQLDPAIKPVADDRTA